MNANTTLRVPQLLHDVLGERARRLDLAVIVFAGVLVDGLFAQQMDFSGIAGWRVVLAIALVADIAAGAVANLTQGTNDYYVERPAHRWGFLAIHVHVLVLAWAVQAPLSQAVALWAFTILSASVVNLQLNRPSQASVAGTLVTIGVAGVLLWQPGGPPAVLLVYVLFLFKVVFSFAVDHHAARADRRRNGVHPLSPRDQDAFISLIVDAFAKDPLFVHLFPLSHRNADRHRRSFASFVLDLNRIFGGTPRGLFVDGQLVAGWLLDPPLPRWRQALASVLAVVRGVPLLVSLGPARMQWLNEYTRRTRAVMPPGPHHYLVMLGVHPDRQGSGYGGTALRAIAAEVLDSDGSHGVGLDTENQSNVALYERFGYSSLESQVFGEQVTAYCMVRRNAG